MALGGAWTRTQMARNWVRFEGRTFGAAADAAVLGLDGDGGADTGFTLPANWPLEGPLTGALTDAIRHRFTQMIFTNLSSPAVGATGSAAVFITEGSGPWRRTVTIGSTPTAPLTLRVDVFWLHSIDR